MTENELNGAADIFKSVLVKAERIGGYRELNALALWLAKQRVPLESKQLVKYLELRRAELHKEPAITSWGK